MDGIVDGQGSLAVLIYLQRQRGLKAVHALISMSFLRLGERGNHILKRGMLS